jgi:hypothetical protein
MSFLHQHHFWVRLQDSQRQSRSCPISTGHSLLLQETSPNSRPRLRTPERKEFVVLCQAAYSVWKNYVSVNEIFFFFGILFCFKIVYIYKTSGKDTDSQCVKYENFKVNTPNAQIHCRTKKTSRTMICCYEVNCTEQLVVREHFMFYFYFHAWFIFALTFYYNFFLQ